MSYSGQTTRHSPCLCLTKTMRKKEDQHGQRGEEEVYEHPASILLAQRKSELPKRPPLL